MEVFRVSAYYMAPQGLNVVNLAAACPKGESWGTYCLHSKLNCCTVNLNSSILSLTGGVLFTEDMISWHVPRRVTPLLDGSITVSEMHMGINGQRLDRSQMAARGYTLSTTDFHIVVEIPLGSPDGYYEVGNISRLEMQESLVHLHVLLKCHKWLQSHAPDYQYHITYFVEPMLEVLWRADDTQDDTRYKVLFPIMTPLMPQSPQVQDGKSHYLVGIKKRWRPKRG